MSGNRVIHIDFTETIKSTSTEHAEEDTCLANTTEMEPSEPSCSTSCATSDAENQAQ